MSSFIKSLKRPDAFTQSVRGAAEQLSKRTGAVVAAIVGLLVILVGVGFWMNQRAERARKAGDLLYQAGLSLQKELTALAEAKNPKSTQASAVTDPSDKAKKSPPAPVKADPSQVAYDRFDVDAKLPQSVQAYRALIEKYEGTRAAFEAKLVLGDLYFDHGEPAKAVGWYEKAVQKASSSADRALATIALGYAHENAGNWKEALAAFERAKEGSAEIGLKGDLLLAMGRCYEGLKDKEKARSAYDQVISQLPNSEFAKKAELLKAQL